MFAVTQKVHCGQKVIGHKSVQESILSFSIKFKCVNSLGRKKYSLYDHVDIPKCSISLTAEKKMCVWFNPKGTP